MLRSTLAAFSAALLTTCISAQPPGFDCAKASTPQEKAICASPDLSRADAEMTAAYRSLLTAVPPGVQAEIRENQHAWLRYRLSLCNPANTANFTQCLLEAENSRTTTLLEMVQHYNGITFVWRSVYLIAPDDADTAKIMKQENGRDSGYVNASWPQAQSTAPEWLVWNKAIAEAVGPGSAQGGDKPKTQWSPSDAVDQDTDVTVTLNSVSDTLVSASIAVMTYGHGGAPNHGTTQFNWMLKEQRPLKLQDVFQPKSHWKAEFYARTSKYLHSKLDDNGEDQAESRSGTVDSLIAEPNHWQIDSKGITIVFNPYEVACYACTPEPFTMTWESLKPLLNPAFQIPR